MNYENFKDQFISDVSHALYEQGAEVDVTVREINKLNESYDAITVTPEGGNIGVNIGINRYFDAYEKGASYNEIIDAAVDSISHGLEQKPDVDLASLRDYGQMKETLVMEVVSAEANQELLEGIPHKDMEDMAVVYRFMIDSNEDGRASILVTNNLINNMGVTPEQLHADAMENAPELKPAVIKGMSEVMAEMMGVSLADLDAMGGVPTMGGEEAMYVATVPDKIHGAGVLAYQDFMDQAAERAGGDFFILPSSIHEILIVPDNGEMNLTDLEAMVKEVNATEVAPEDKLTDSVYHYDSKAKIFELGEKFVARQAKKDAEHSEEKASLLGDLKSKKEEVAKAPKKEVIDKGAKAKGGEVL